MIAKIIQASLEQIDRLGTKKWIGFAFTWMACMAARANEPDRAMHNLEVFVKAFTSRNGFHLNGDYKRLGYSDFVYRPFTLEGNFGASQAVHRNTVAKLRAALFGCFPPLRKNGATWPTVTSAPRGHSPFPPDARPARPPGFVSAPSEARHFGSAIRSTDAKCHGTAMTSKKSATIMSVHSVSVRCWKETPTR